MMYLPDGSTNMTLKQRALSWTIPLALLAGPALADSAPVPRPAGLEQAWTPSPGDQIRFNVLRKGNPFGSHSVTFEEGPDGALVARTDVSLRAGLGPLTVFRYTLSASETWRGGELVRVDGRVNDDGKRANVSARRQNGVLAVEGTKFSGKAPEEAVPASHWNYAQTRTGRLLSTEDGEILDVDVRRKGRETIRAGGRMIEANRYLMASDIDVDLWYDDAGRWVKLAFEARGQQIEYVLEDLY